MQAHFAALQMAVLFFPLVASLAFLPLFVLHRRRFGELHEYRAFVSFLFLFSILAALCLTTLPLPELDQVACDWRQRIERNQFIPFDSFVEIERFRLKHSLKWNLDGLLLNKALWQILFNTLMLLPFGLLLRSLYGTGLLKVTVLAICFSLAMELTQLTAVWGLARCPYRVFDVDDLLCNTAGAILGWLIYGGLGVLPSPRSSEDELWYRKAINRDDNDPGYMD